MTPIDKITATVNQHFTFEGKELDDIDFLPIDSTHFHVLYNNKSYKAALVHANYEDKNFLIKINGSNYSIQLADKYDQLIEKLGLNVTIKHAVLDIKAPMPGLVLDVLVKEGQEVEEGTPILILEAMKMENVLKAVGAGQVKKIEINKGDAVEKGQILVYMDKISVD